MRVSSRAFVPALILVAAVAAGVAATGCAKREGGALVVVGTVHVRMSPPHGWEHVDNGVRHEFRRGDGRMSLVDAGIATPESLASAILAARPVLTANPPGRLMTGLEWRDDPVLVVRPEDEQRGFWRYWNEVDYDPVRAASSERLSAFDTLVTRARALAPLDKRLVTRWACAQQMDTATTYQIDRVSPATPTGSTWWVAHTWMRGSHQFIRQYACGFVGGHVLVLESGPILDPDHQKAFDQLIASMEPGGR